MNLEEMIRGSMSADGFISNEAMKAAMDNLTEKRSKAMTEELVGMMNEAIKEARSFEVSAAQLEKEAATSRALANKVLRAVQYFGATGNPLPYFSSIGQRTEAAEWCKNHGLNVPNKDSDSWNVPEDFRQ